MAKPTEQVRATVTESAGLGGDANDDYGVPADIDPTEDVLVAAGIFFGAPANAEPSDGTVAIYIDPADGKLYFEDIDNLGPGARRTLADLVAGVGGLTPGSHRPLDQLVHAIAEDSFEEVNRTGSKIDSIIVWTTVGKTQKIREEIFTYTGSQITTIVSKQYDAAGALIAGETMTETLSYTGANLDDTTRVMS
jgi:hypothetical protein